MKRKSFERVAPRAGTPWCAGAVALALVFAVGEPARAGDTAHKPLIPHPVEQYDAGPLEVRTDLPPAAARDLVRRLEGTLRTAERYWRRPCDQRIVCFVVDDLAAWPDEALPNPQARYVLRHVRGGMEALPSGPGMPREAHIYATSERGIAEHELVHAYCVVSFGTCGPDWYKEGMAEMAYHGRPGDHAVRCSRKVARLLRVSRGTPIRQIVGADAFGRPIAERITAVSSPPRPIGLGAPSSEVAVRWRASDAALVENARLSYHRSWALCHFLASNPNYSDRFRQLGIGYLTQTGVTFEQVFGPVEERMAFEFRLFLRNIDDGYRADLCRWEWDAHVAPLVVGESRAIRIAAARGYQPAGITVTKDETYAYESAGRWRTCRRHGATSADGSYFGCGSLEAVIMHDYELGTPIELGEKGSFVARRSGMLYLRCRDDWQRLADNTGSVEVRLTLCAAGE